ncbi:nuclear transport factor 2 family protein [Flavobacterium selenitireducens]|uniref:nuclear transport factor 2 family protein n=1 Tax=Flavobacterium selenitireducens TaxID=2722704 RepID=UPI00168BA086|nr:nuclear transport factor 2 family protein [Flavobacterium selenitireducens]MBD3582504.1 nuclear transport factor 2 family protein [Flavobacterium selenitireducens]
MKPFLQNWAGLLLLFLNLTCLGQTTDVENIIRESDRSFWTAYNNCDIDGMHRFIADDVEFYHDKGGLQKGWQTFEETSRKNLCSRTGWRLRREPIENSIQFYPMASNGKIYGAILSGDHKFYVTENGQPEFASGVAKFTHLWLLENGNWKMTRILSYDHGPVPYVNMRKSIRMSPKQLRQFQGKYDSADGVITVTPNKTYLSLSLGDKNFDIFPESAAVFFTKERDLTFGFIKSGNKIAQLVVTENGGVVARAKKSD